MYFHVKRMSLPTQQVHELALIAHRADAWRDGSRSEHDMRGIIVYSTASTPEDFLLIAKGALRHQIMHSGKPSELEYYPSGRRSIFQDFLRVPPTDGSSESMRKLSIAIDAWTSPGPKLNLTPLEIEECQDARQAIFTPPERWEEFARNHRRLLRFLVLSAVRYPDDDFILRRAIGNDLTSLRLAAVLRHPSVVLPLPRGVRAVQIRPYAMRAWSPFQIN